NNQLFLLGGFQNDSTTMALKNDVWSSSDGANWTQVTAAAGWSARDNFTAVAANNGIYVYGGDAGSGTLMDDVWFSSDGATWQQLTASATGIPRFTQAMFFFQNKLWIIGGYSDAAGTLTIDDVCTSPDGQTWTTTSPVFGVGKAEMGYTIYKNRMWLIAGFEGPTVTHNVWKSNTTGTAWTLVTTTPGFTARGGPSVVTFATPLSVSPNRYQSMWMMGGNDGLTDLQENWYANIDDPLPSSFALNPSVALQSYDFSPFLNNSQLLIKNSSNFWVLQAGTLIPVTDTNYPVKTVPGLVVLNSFAYVME